MPSKLPRYRHFTFAAVCHPDKIYEIAGQCSYVEWNYSPENLMCTGYIQFSCPRVTPTWLGVQAVFESSSLSYMTIDHVPKTFLLGVPALSLKGVKPSIAKSHIFGPEFDKIIRRTSTVKPPVPPTVPLTALFPSEPEPVLETSAIARFLTTDSITDEDVITEFDIDDYYNELDPDEERPPPYELDGVKYPYHWVFSIAAEFTSAHVNGYRATLKPYEQPVFSKMVLAYLLKNKLQLIYFCHKRVRAFPYLTYCFISLVL